jgi:hypothetical protein
MKLHVLVSGVAPIALSICSQRKKRGYMKKETQKAKLAALLGLEDVHQRSEIEAAAVSREAEAVLAMTEHPKAFTRKICKEPTCRRSFAHSEACVAYCSDHCRAKALDRIGIQWHWLKPPSSRWGKTYPLVVPAEALAVMDELPTVTQITEVPQESPPDTPDVLDILAKYGL